ncbi:ornithine cyclodeaminase family protein [Dongia deserti]|uniref:ornithine cyclodeaminase family protein n=1 Tax=Dongia deserti TaxID=2268030 RepID=UPI000E655C33|nr:ornithine cyclodeaminase family protein [Dongia deserti]
MTRLNTQATARAAAEIHKGEIGVLCLSEAEVMALLDPSALLNALAEGFRRLAAGRVQAPARPEIRVPGAGFSLAMPAWSEGMSIAVKVVNVFDGNLALDLPSHLATITLFDPRTGSPRCMMDGTYITAIRTAASAILSVRELARRDSRTATVIGAGVQAREHLRLLPLVAQFEYVRLASLRFADAQRLAAHFAGVTAIQDVESAVRTSDVVCLATHAPESVIRTDWLRPGTHVTSVGYYPPRGELPFDLPRRHRLFVESSESFEPPPVGCAELQGVSADHGTPLGDVLLGRRPGRESAAEITVYKAMGVAMEDLVAAELVYAEARRKGVGREVPF